MKVPNEKYIVQLPKHIVVLYASEIQRLLYKDEDLYLLAMKRGKSEKRYRANEKRHGQTGAE